MVENNGNITAPLGQVNLAVGDKISVAAGEGLSLEVTVDESLKEAVEGFQAAVRNTGTIDAAGGLVTLQAKLSENFFQHAVNNTGIIMANALEGHGGAIRLLAKADSGDAIARNGGTLDASGTDATPDGGYVTLAGDYAIQAGTAKADGAEGGQGGNVDITSTQGTLLKAGSLTSARGAGANSDAGEIFIWSDKDTYFRNGASIDVRGGSTSGDGGFVEVSGLRTVFFQGQAFGGASNGKAGRILIDPATINIDNAGSGAVNGGDTPGGPDETFAEDPGATLSLNPQAAGAFNGFGDIHLQATTAINVNSPFDSSIASAGNTTTPVNLTLESYTNIVVNAPITTRNANIRLWANSDNGGAGSLTINSGGTINANGGNVTLEGAQISLGDNVNGNNVTVSIYSAFGSGHITHTGGTLTGNTVSLSSTSGNIGTAMNPILVNTPPASLTTNTSGSINVTNNYVAPAPAPTPTTPSLDPAPLLRSAPNSGTSGNPSTGDSSSASRSNGGGGTTASQNTGSMDTTQLGFVGGDPGMIPVNDTGVNILSSPQHLREAIMAFHNGDSALLSRSIGQNAYVANRDGNSVRVLDAATGRQVGSIDVGRHPIDIAIDGPGHTAYVTNAGSNSVSVIDTRTNTVTDTISVGDGPHGLATSPSGDRLFVANTDGNSMSVIDTTTRQILATVATGGRPTNIAVSPDGQFAYVTNAADGTVSVVNTVNNLVTATVKVGENPQSIVVSPGNGQAFVLNAGDGTLSVINPATQQVGQTVALEGKPSGLSLSADGKTLFVANQTDGTFTAMDAQTLTVRNTLPVSALPWH